MIEFSVTTQVALLGLLLGGIFGATAHRTNFCTMGAVSDLVMMDDWNRFRAWLLAIAVGIFGTQVLHLAGYIDINNAIYLTPSLGWLGAILGGLMFGFGMTQAGGCGSKTLIRLGAGNLKSLIVALILGVFAYMTLRGLIALGRTALEGATNIDMLTIGANNQGIPDALAASGVIDIDTARLLVSAIAVLGLLWFCLKDADFRASKPDVIAGIVIGLCVPAGWIITGIVGFDEFEPTQMASLTFVAPVANSIQYLMTFTGSTIDFGISTVGGVILGSFISAKLAGEFKFESFVGTDDMLRHIGGAALMGIGGVLALGCTIGQGLTGMSTLAIGALLAFLSIVAGGVLGMKYIEEGSFGGAVAAMMGRG
ncbi:YeeE/YedE family protein [Thalassospiraceae bacterium LMO-JJ14]|nr:YeeE/YedE family protein [Thalassospiraceae bacterium LMO-JJ14]